jgi:class 3 adenylate cyclase
VLPNGGGGEDGRALTVLFADVVGSTRLGETLDPEVLRDVLGEVVATIVLAVELAGGTVQDIAGDGVLALFTAPADALAAAATINGAIAELRAEPGPWGAQESLNVRVGVHLDRVEVQPLAGRAVGRVTGPGVDGAIALEAAATPGTTLVSVDALEGATDVLTSDEDVAATDPPSRQLDGLVRRLLPGLADLRRARATGDQGRDERRTVVALFAAVIPVGAHDVDGERIAHRIGSVARTVERFGGYVKDTAGDVVVALFGAPVAHGDDVDRAVQCALTITAADDSGADVRVRCGVASGPAVVGSVGAGSRVEFGAVGDAMNTAARLQAKSGPGRVLVTEAVRRRVTRPVAWGDRSELMVKGKAEPVVAFEVGPATVRESVAHTAGLVGREEAVGRLAGLANAEGAVIVEAEPGLGASPVARAVAERLGAPTTVVELAPWDQQERLSSACAIVEALRSLGPIATDAAPAAVDVGDAIRQLQDEIDRASGLLGPITLLVDDLHHADTASLEAVAELLERRHPSSTWIATSRTGATPSQLDGLAARQVLGPLGADASRQLLEALVGVDALPYDVERRVLDTAAGGPLFLVELARAVDAGTTDLPDSLERVALARVDAMGPAARGVLDAAAVLDPHIDDGVLASVCGTEVSAELQLLVRGRVLVVDGDGRIRFEHPLVRDGAYQALVRRDRQRLHLAAARVLAPSADPSVVARHLHLGGALVESYASAVEAGDQARLRQSDELAADMYEIAAEAAELVSGRSRSRAALLLDAARSHHAAGRLDLALERAAEASEAAGPDEAEVIGLAAVEYEDVYFATRRTRDDPGNRSRALFERARSIGFTSPTAMTRAYAAMGRARWYEGDTEAARALTERALRTARSCGQPDDLAYALLAWRTARESPDQLHERLATSDELLAALANPGQDLALDIEARRLVLMDRLTAGHLEAAFADLGPLIERIERTGQLRWAWYVPMWRAMQALVVDDVARAEEQAAELRQIGRRARYRDVASVHALLAYLVARRTGELGEIDALFERAAATAGPRWHVFSASYAAVTGDLAGASEHLRSARSIAGALGGDRGGGHRPGGRCDRLDARGGDGRIVGRADPIAGVDGAGPGPTRGRRPAPAGERLAGGAVDAVVVAVRRRAGRRDRGDQGGARRVRGGAAGCDRRRLRGDVAASLWRAAGLPRGPAGNDGSRRAPLRPCGCARPRRPPSR